MAHERTNLILGVVQLTNNLGVFIVSCTGNFAIRVALSQILMDTRDQPTIIGKLLTNALGLTASNLEPCPFTILTLLGEIERDT